MVAQQSQGVGHIPAHRNHQGTGDVGLVDDLLHAHHAGQKVGKTLVVVAAVLKLQAVLGVYHTAAQVGVHQGHLHATLGQGPHQVHGQIALALRSVAAGDHDLFYSFTCKGQVGAQGVEGLAACIVQFRKFCDLQLFHAFLPAFPPTRRRISLLRRFMRRWKLLPFLGSVPPTRGTEASTTMPVYLRISSADL